MRGVMLKFQDEVFTPLFGGIDPFVVADRGYLHEALGKRVIQITEESGETFQAISSTTRASIQEMGAIFRKAADACDSFHKIAKEEKVRS